MFTVLTSLMISLLVWTASAANVEVYKIQSRDRLTDLSRILYGDAAYWPKIWGQKQGENPLLIRSGHELQFLAGNEDDTPAFRFSENSSGGGVSLAAGDVPVSAPRVVIPPPEVKPKPVARIPHSFPEWQSVFKKIDDRIKIEDRGIVARINSIQDQIYLTAYVQDDAIDPAGYYLQAEAESALPVENQYVYLKMREGKAVTGQKYLIVNDRGRLVKMVSLDAKLKAHLIQIAAEVQMAEAVPTKFKKGVHGWEVYRALITKSTGLSLKDFSVVPGEIEKVELSANGPPATVSAQVIGSARHEASTLFGPGDIIFLDKGSKDGVSAGQLLDVFVDRSIRDEDVPVTQGPIPSGLVKIVRVAEGVSTGVLLRSRDGILQGDRAQEHADLGARLKQTEDSIESDLQKEMSDH